MRIALLAVSLGFACAANAQDCGAPLKSELLERKTADQTARERLKADPSSREASDATLRVDADNTAYMRKVLAKCGWPRKSIVGPEAARAAWLLAQHADMDPEFQVMAARQMKYEVHGGEADALDLAVLVDRNRRLNDQPQVYGMQYYSTADGAIRFYDIVTPGQLDQRRKRIGLPSFFCWISDVSRQNKGAPVHWPDSVLFQPSSCDNEPR